MLSHASTLEDTSRLLYRVIRPSRTSQAFSLPHRPYTLAFCKLVVIVPLHCNTAVSRSGQCRQWRSFNFCSLGWRRLLWRLHGSGAGTRTARLRPGDLMAVMALGVPRRPQLAPQAIPLRRTLKLVSGAPARRPARPPSSSRHPWSTRPILPSSRRPCQQYVPSRTESHVFVANE